MGKSIITFAVLAGIFYLLYRNGYIAISSKRATTFYGSCRGRTASFTNCTGYLKRIVRPKETKTATIFFDCTLTKGVVELILLNAEKQRVLCLNDTQKTATITVEKRKTYYLILQFQSATGRYTLDWQ